MRSDPFYMTYISANGIGDDNEENDDYDDEKGDDEKDDDENGDDSLYDKHHSQWNW